MKNVTDFRKTVETGVDPRPKLLLNDDSESFLSNKYTSKALHQMLQTTEMNILKFQNPFNLLQVCPSRPTFVFVVLSTFC